MSGDKGLDETWLPPGVTTREERRIAALEEQVAKLEQMFLAERDTPRPWWWPWRAALEEVGANTTTRPPEYQLDTARFGKDLGESTQFGVMIWEREPSGPGGGYRGVGAHRRMLHEAMNSALAQARETGHLRGQASEATEGSNAT